MSDAQPLLAFPEEVVEKIDIRVWRTRSPMVQISPIKKKKERKKKTKKGKKNNDEEKGNECDFVFKIYQ